MEVTDTSLGSVLVATRTQSHSKAWHRGCSALYKMQACLQCRGRETGLHDPLSP